MIKIGIFFNCDKDLEKNVIDMKSFFKKKSSSSLYLDHLPHMTIYVIDIEKEKFYNVVQDFNKLENYFNKFQADLKGWKIFENDFLTNLNTLCLEIDLTNDLEALQRKVVNTLYKYSVNINHSELKGNYLKSYQTYGYPFVGKHWIPHITVGSLSMNPEALINYSNNLFSYPNKVLINNLSLYTINGDDHKLIQKIIFNGNS